MGTAAIGIPAVSAAVDSREYISGETALYSNLDEGDFCETGVILSTNHLYGTKADIAFVYIDDKHVAIVEGEYTFTQSVYFVSIEKSGSVYKMYFRSIVEEDDVEINTEEALREKIKGAETVYLTGDIEMTRALSVRDGKSHIINTNGYSLKATAFGENIIKVENGTTLTIIGDGANGLSKLYGASGERGGHGISVTGKSKLIMRNITCSDNSSNYGAGVYVVDSTAEITDCTIENNKAAEDGGGVYLMGESTATLKNCTIANNSANRARMWRLEGATGGGVYVGEGSTATLTDCVINGNASYIGGGVGSYGTLTLERCKVKSNSSKTTTALAAAFGQMETRPLSIPRSPKTKTPNMAAAFSTWVI